MIVLGPWLKFTAAILAVVTTDQSVDVITGVLVGLVGVVVLGLRNTSAKLSAEREMVPG